IEDKYSVLDVRAKTSKGEIIHIEIQRKDEGDMLKRSLYYMDEVFTEQIESGDSYHKLNRVVSIIIMNYNTDFIPNDSFHNVYRFYNVRTGEELTDLQELHYIELKKMTYCDGEDVLQLFLEFLKDPYSEVVESKSGEIKELSKAKQKLANLSRDPKTRDAFNAREKALKDKNSAFYNAELRGEIRGKREGKLEGKLEVAKNLLGKLEDSEIATITGLPIEQIENIKVDSRRK
ncbi:MAG: Rpn family recombination-promoting nuclease/putative transposase, partial [Eubacteriales bacterium]